MRVLVVGSTSVIGRAIGARARALGEVRFAGRRDADYRLDLAGDTLPDVAERFDAVVHVAADFGGPSDGDALRAERVNAGGTLLACALARRVGARQFVLLSSISATYRPGDPHYGIYALSKRHAEEAAAWACDTHGLALAVLRPTQVYDDLGACRARQPLLYAMVDRAERGEDIQLHGTHDALRNYLHVEDLAEACGRTLELGIEGVHACAHPEDVRLSEVARAAFDAFGRGGEVRFDPTREDLRDLPATDAASFHARIGVRPAIGIREGMARIRRARGVTR